MAEIDWDTITQPQARRLVGPAASHEQAVAKRWDAGEATDAEWKTALMAEEDLRVFAICGVKPGEDG